MVIFFLSSICSVCGLSSFGNDFVSVFCIPYLMPPPPFFRTVPLPPCCKDVFLVFFYLTNRIICITM
jgi:hypothetical protein